ncbi:hypothetical protein MUN81_19265 [Hymenobacter sp. 5317J-9]|uniref:hypothetical protein n=1 Tax=Hymenobacter sp. 5317J-9 TaxID=2932250 RepID=UPI001FD6386E|nr:hypothetical protein [Hymenobacter sp. 5317J-9]UOQ97363.1 hypothetical protein MUN81_19265 [Hymenobacter sp. 5317J-9]
MKKTLLSAGLLFGLVFSAHAQQPAGPETMRTHADTVQALHNLFGKHRTGGIIWSGIGAAVAVRVATASASGDGGGNAGGTAVGIGVLGGVPALIGVGKLLRFSSSREAAAIAAYDAGKALPRYVQKRLVTKYFSR